MRTARPSLRVPRVATLGHCSLATRPRPRLPIPVGIRPRCANIEYKPCVPCAPSPSAAPANVRFKVINTDGKSLITLITFHVPPKNRDTTDSYAGCRPSTHHSAPPIIPHSTFPLRPSSKQKPANPTRNQTPKTPTPPGIPQQRRLGVTPANLRIALIPLHCASSQPVASQPTPDQN